MDAKKLLAMFQAGQVAGGTNDQNELVIFFASNDGSELRVAIKGQDDGFTKVVRYEVCTPEGEIEEG